MTATTPDSRSPDAFRQDFLRFALACDVLRFGEFKTKSGRLSPYFFNSGLFNTGESLHRLGRYYADAALASGVAFDMTFGPEVKFISAPTKEQGQNLPPSAGLQFFGLVDIDSATEQLTVRLMNRDDKELWKVTLDPARAA